MAENIQSCSNAGNASPLMAYEDWLSILDLVGPFGELLHQQELLDCCPDRSKAEALQLAGLVAGREGLPAEMPDDPEYMAGWQLVSERGRW